MSDASIISNYIKGLLEELLDDGATIKVKWLAHKIIGDTGGAPVNDFQAAVLYRGVRECLRKEINALVGDSSDQTRQSQLTLPGYEHLHAFYSISRNDDELIVDVHSMSDEELKKKENLYRSFGRACFAHADELASFREQRTIAV